MATIKTDAWVLYESENPTDLPPGHLQRETISFPDIEDHEVLVEPLYGCWEANMSHALERKPVDICRQRKEQKIVLGNSGVVRVLETGPGVTTVEEGDLCVIFAVATTDRHGFPEAIYAYDAPGTMGILARQIKVPQRVLIPIPQDTKYTLPQWAAFSLRYFTAWSNWIVAYPVWRVQMREILPSEAYVAGWGGGVSLAELALARYHGFQTLMIASGAERLQLIDSMGMQGIDRRQFPDLRFAPAQYDADPVYRKTYRTMEKLFIDAIMQATGGEGVSIFVDNIGLPVFRATLRVLARQGVVTTAGWKHGMELSVMRAVECIKRHIHVHTHGACYPEGLEAVAFGEEHGWMPPHASQVYAWEDIPQLADDYAHDRLASYFPIYAINA